MTHYSVAEAITRKLQLSLDQELKNIALTDLEVVYQYRGSTDPAVLLLSNRLVKSYYAGQALVEDVKEAEELQRLIDDLKELLNTLYAEHDATKEQLDDYKKTYG